MLENAYELLDVDLKKIECENYLGPYSCRWQFLYCVILAHPPTSGRKNSKAATEPTSRRKKHAKARTRKTWISFRIFENHHALLSLAADSD